MLCAYMTWWRWRSIYRTCKIIPVDYFLLWHYLFAIDSKGALEIIIIRPCIDTRARKIFNVVVISICNRVFFPICWTLNANTTTTDIYTNDGGKNLYWMCTMVWKRRFDSATCTVFSIHCLSKIHTVIFAAMKFNRFTSELLSLEWETFRRSINIKLKYDFKKSEIFQYCFLFLILNWTNKN